MRDYQEAMADPDATAEDRRRLHDAVLVACNEPPRFAAMLARRLAVPADAEPEH